MSRRRNLSSVPEEFRKPGPERPRGILLSDVEKEEVVWL